MRSKGRIGVGEREGKGARAFMLSFVINSGFLAGKKSLQKSQMMDPIALLLDSILLGIFCSFQTSWNSMARAGSRGNLSLEVK